MAGNAMLERLDKQIAKDEAALDAALAEGNTTLESEAPGESDDASEGTPAPPTDGKTTLESEAPGESDGTQGSDADETEGASEDESADDPVEPEASVLDLLDDEDPEQSAVDEQSGQAPYEQQWRTLRGKYDAETKKLRDENAELKAQHKAVLAERNTLLTQASGPISPEQLRDDFHLSDDEIDAIGPETASGMYRMVRSMTEGMQQEHREAVDALRAEYEAEVTAQADASFRSRIAEEYPELKGSDALVKFVRLDGERLQNFKTGLRTHNERAVSDIVKLFRAETKSRPKPSLEGQEMPTGRSKTPKQTPKVHSEADVKKMHDDFMRNRGDMTDAEQEAASKELDAAEDSLLVSNVV